MTIGQGGIARDSKCTLCIHRHSITSDGRNALGCVIGSVSFIFKQASSNINIWITELNTFKDITKTHPQAAYSSSGLVHGMFKRLIYFFKTCHNIEDLLLPLKSLYN